MADKWQTAITEVKPNEIRLKGYLVSELMGTRSFAETVWLALTGELPPPQRRALIEALLTCGVDHGVTPPSALATRVATGTGASLSQAVASGVLAINAFHGGAIEGCMLALKRGLELKAEQDLPLELAAAALLEELKRDGKRMPGYGHRVHTDDPRTARLRTLAREAGVYGEHLLLADAIENHFVAKGKPLPLNVDGAMGALLCELNIEPAISNGFFILARVAGLIAHFNEERSRERPMRRIDQGAAEYDGPPARELP